MDRPHDHDTQSDAPPMPTEAELIAGMDEDDADVDGESTVPVSDVLAEMDEVIARMKAARARRA